MEELGIAAGLQDRVIQTYGGLVYMDFSKALMEVYIPLGSCVISLSCPVRVLTCPRSEWVQCLSGIHHGRVVAMASTAIWMPARFDSLDSIACWCPICSGLCSI